MINILLIPLTRAFIMDFIDYIASKLNEIFTRSIGKEITVNVWPIPEKLPMKCFNWGRVQFNSSCVINWLYKKFQEYTKHYIIAGIGYIDGYVNEYNFIFGEASPYMKVCVVYTKRLSPTFYGQEMDYNLYVTRVIKEVTHEIGHVLGLGHCNNRECVMSFSNSVYEVDAKTYYFCNSCLTKIRDYR